MQEDGSRAAGINGKLMGGQQPVTGAKLYLYAVSTASTAGPATSLLDGPGYVVTGLGGSFSITGDYTCPSGAYVYLLALGGNPGLVGANNADSALVAGLGACSALTANSFFVVNEATTVAFAEALGSFAASETQAGSATASDMSTAFANMAAAVNPSTGLATGGPFDSTDPDDVRRVKTNALANSLAACVNSDGTGGACSSLMADANVSATNNTPVDTVQAAINIANNVSTNVAAIYNLGIADAPFQPTLASAPCDWYITTSFSEPSFFDNACFLGEETGSPIFYLSFPDGRFFGYYVFLSGTQGTGYPYLYHYDMGYEYIVQAGPEGALTFYDVTSNHYWNTSSESNAPYPFPSMFDTTLNEEIQYVVDTTQTGHYTTNPRYFYVPSTGQTISF